VEFLHRVPGHPQRLGILSGSFHPPTFAHLALAEAGLRDAGLDEVLLVLPRRFPHEKGYEGVTLEDRARMLRALAPAGLSSAITDGGLFLEIAAEARPHYPGAELWFLCGADAAQRIVEWDYGRPGVAGEMLREFGMLVAARQGEYTPPEHLRDRVRPLCMGRGYDEVSATEVRRKIRAGECWQDLVPPALHRLVDELYR
jgi:nicotinic acid mononucleotide adenylyltransferase